MGLLCALLALNLTACTPILPATPSAALPAVTIEVAADGMVRPGDPVEMRVRGDAAAVGLRLAIDGVDTGWRDPKRLDDHELLYTWVASEPDSYEIVGQARNETGAIAEEVYTLIVLPHAEPTLTGRTRLLETQVTLPTYPLEAYLTDALDPVYAWPYRVFDHARFAEDDPPAAPRRYRLVILENDYLQVSLLPELGGRIWQILHKPSGDTMFYQNAVVKPSPWGPEQQRGWLALGGLEWALPVNEHGYDWGTPWEFTTFQTEDGAVGAQIATPDDGRLITATITVTLAPDVAAVEIGTSIHNRAATSLAFHYWHNAMLAPGPGNRVGPDLRFVLPTRLMTVHSSGDPMLPAPEARISWPRTFGRDMSRLGNWFRYLGLFEYPAAHGPFVGVYDPTLDAGAVRVFPADVARGSKLFALGWREPIGSDAYTDDGSTYVELHGGLSPTFFAPARLASGETVTWQETWYPIYGSGGLVHANATAALAVTPVAAGWNIGLYPTVPFTGTLTILIGGAPTVRVDVDAAPDAPFITLLDRESLPRSLPLRPFTVRVSDGSGRLILSYTASTY